MFLLSDMAQEHFLTKVGMFRKKPIDEAEVDELVSFQRRHDAEAKALELCCKGCHVQCYVIDDFFTLQLQQWAEP